MSKQPEQPIQRHNYTLNDALTSLHQRGKLEDEAALKQRIKTHFGDVFTEEELLHMPLVDLQGTVEVFNLLFPVFTGGNTENQKDVSV